MNNKLKIAIIGCGNIANFHIPAIRDAGFEISGIAGSLNSKNVETFAKKYDINKFYSNPVELIMNVSKWDALLLLSPVPTIVDYLELAAPFGKPILTEKPVALDHLKLKSLIKYNNIRVAFNRRFYSGAIYVKKFIEEHQNSLVKVTIPESRQDPVHNIDFPNRLPLMSYENSVHMFDLMNYISADIKWREVSTIKTLDKYISIVALGYSANGSTIQLDTYYNASDNFSINIISNDYKIEMMPIEVTNIFKGMKVNEPTEEMPIRTYTPMLQNKIIDSPKYGHKPGFLAQAQDFMSFCKGSDDCIGADIVDAYSALKLAHSLIKNERK